MKGIIKRSVCIAAAAAMTLVLCSACGKIAEIDSTALADRLNSSVTFSEQLTEIEGTAAEKRFYLNPNDYTELTAYVGTKATCDEFAIIKTSSPDTVMTKLRGHLEIQKSNYSNYRPNEAQKIDSAVLEEYKDTVVLIVSGDSENAAAVYEAYIRNK